MLNIAIIDDHKLVGAGLAHLLSIEDNFSVACLCSSYAEAIETLTPAINIAIIDISLPDKNGIELVKYLGHTLPSIKTIVVSMYDHYHYISDAITHGAKGYLSKKCAPDELIDALAAIESGETYYSKDITFKLAQHSKSTADIKLTSREFEVLKMLAQGLSPKQVAHSLNIMPKTVLAHRYNLFNKFSVNNQYDLLQAALEQSLLTSSDISLCSP